MRVYEHQNRLLRAQDLDSIQSSLRNYDEHGDEPYS